ncbi:hypothetical protein [Acinetobacter sp. DSM 11652]|uniref:hypothetical protein n=1 Tax=Acinetobacter sp. DSM 11652 TaxID=346222 RepID=UPI0008CD0DD5|nr:hypothetical protein [Acinetobacter sp. DSM 11652]SEM21602.1 hypothetical protein SAMN05216500_11445 [Acinetobacter sp. DSM 11652]
MKDFFLNFSKIVESNSKVYWAIIAGILLCVASYIVEIFHVQNIIAAIEPDSRDQLKQVIPAITNKYTVLRAIIVVLAIAWSIKEYRKTQKLLAANKSSK